MMAESRPDPDALLAQVKAEEARARRGKLRIFFGASAGVGKTFAMLSAAHAVRLTTEVVVGYVEPHGRAQTERLLEGLERLPTLPVDYRGIVRQEFDLDAALEAPARRSCSSTSWRTRTSSAASRRRATRSAGRTSRSCSRPASTSGPP